jgi:hypothetical protein
MSKKISIFLVSFFLLFIFAPPAYGGLESEIREDIREIRGRLKDLLVDVEDLLEGEMVVATFPRIPDDFRFPEVRPFRYEDHGDEIFYMQIILNTDPETRLADSGVGSPGNENRRFGNITKNAVIKFQEKYAKEILHPWGIYEPTGIAAIQTQKKLNKILSGEVIIKIMDPDKQAAIREEILKIAQMIRETNKKIDLLEEGEEGALDAPTNVRGAIIGYGEVRLTWTGHRDAEYFVGYVAERSGGPRERQGTTTRNSGIITGLEGRKTYYLTVTQVVDGRESGHSREVVVNIRKDPTPFNIRGDATDIGEITLTWETDQRNVSSYRVYRSTKQGGPYVLLGQTTNRSYKDMGVGLYTVYYYTVTQIIDGKESDFGAEYADSWFYNWQGGTHPHPEKEVILDNLKYDL